MIAALDTVRIPDAVFPGPPLQVRVLGGLIRFEEAREHARRLACWPMLFDDPAAVAVAALVMDGEPVPDMLRSDCEEWADWSGGFAPTDPGWACRLIDRLAYERAALLIAPTLRWGADALERGWRSAADVRRIVNQAFDTAGVIEENVT